MREVFPMTTLMMILNFNLTFHSIQITIKYFHILLVNVMCRRFLFLFHFSTVYLCGDIRVLTSSSYCDEFRCRLGVFSSAAEWLGHLKLEQFCLVIIMSFVCFRCPGSRPSIVTSTLALKASQKRRPAPALDQPSSWASPAVQARLRSIWPPLNVVGARQFCPILWWPPPT